MLFGEQLAKSIIDLQTKRTAQAACAACAEDHATRYAIAFGQPVALCDAECYVMLIANWTSAQAHVV